MTLIYVAIFFVIILVFYMRKSTHVSPITERFTLMPVNETYTFADPIPDDSSSFDKILSRFVDKTIYTKMSDNTPEPAPYVDSEIEAIARKVLMRVKGPDAPSLDFISVEYATKSVDDKKNIHYDISFMVYDKDKNYSVKLALVCMVDKEGVLWVKKFASFNSGFRSRVETPYGANRMDNNVSSETFAKFSPDFIPFAELY